MVKLRVGNTNFGDTEDDGGVGQEKWGLREIGGGRADSIRIPPSVNHYVCWQRQWEMLEKFWKYC